MLKSGRRDGVAVVAAHEYDGARARGGDVEGRVEVAFRGGAFAEVASCYSRGKGGVQESLELESVGGAGGLRDLSGEGGGDCEL